MNWEAIGAVGEMLGAAGVVVSLIYLAAQIRHNTRQVDGLGRSQRLENLNEVAHGWSHWRELITTNREVASIWRRGRADLDALDDDERVQFDNLVIEMFWRFGMLSFYSDEEALGRFPEELTRSNLALLADHPGVRHWWTISPHRTEFPDELIKFVDDFYGERG